MSQLLIRQLDLIRVLPFPFVLLGKNLLEPVRLSLSSCLVCECGIMKDAELLTATVTPQSAHFFEIWCPLSPLTLLDRHCVHRLTFYLAAYPSIFSVRAVVPCQDLTTQQTSMFPNLKRSFTGCPRFCLQPR